ncbi:CRISPR-associated endonuclease Cas2 [Herpetosiphon giganteus]|uniref:CRISPR-associated endonuclease Cas2 n=1 Tax=Herpetosiphon giganteus TaxID=2029754 RepID=UPI001958A248|nr:CRISPR-associated endonuclease Cas2 [Herpetosiphon giganteus]MBM7846738.1 CRISPR-associated protein Cas2 [Herpetosiphon giganteus]
MADSTLYIIAYDIPNDQRRSKIHKLLCGYGYWTQYSLFECWLTKRHLVELRAKLNQIVEPALDTVRLYRVCGACVEQAITFGSPQPREAITIIL